MALPADRETMLREIAEKHAERFRDLASLVAVLLAPRRPSAVAGFVVAVYIDAVKRETERAFPHVLREVGIRLLPSLAHGDATTPVVAIVIVRGVEASQEHGSPRIVRGFVSAFVKLLEVVTDAKAGSHLLAVAVGKRARASIGRSVAALASGVQLTQAVRLDGSLARRHRTQVALASDANGLTGDGAATLTAIVHAAHAFSHVLPVATFYGAETRRTGVNSRWHRSSFRCPRLGLVTQRRGILMPSIIPLGGIA